MATTKTLTVEELLDHIATMTVSDVSKLVKMMEEKFDISAAAPVAAVAAAPEEAAAAAEQTEFEVMLTSFGESKINVIKTIRAITGLALKEAKDLVEGVPSSVKAGVSKDDAEAILKQITEAGASGEIK